MAYSTKKEEYNVCAHCGVTFQQKTMGRPARFCSINCKRAYEKAQYKPRIQPVTLQCVYCGKSFASNHAATKYCSANCKKTANNESRPVYEKVCSWCGKAFTTKIKDQICCSPECGRKQAHETLKKYFICQHCGKPFWRENAFRMKYCSPDCQWDAMRQRTIERHKDDPPKETVVYNRVCPICGNRFDTLFPNHIYCSSGCTYEANLRQKREQWAAAYVPRTFTCKECGRKVTTQCGSTPSVFCSYECQQRYVDRSYKQRRQQQMKSAYREPVSFKKIYKRDGGVCQICGLPVPYDKSPEKLWSATIDHIKPLSLGGTHEPSNCQLAHRLCNSVKLTEAEDFNIDWQEKNAIENGRWDDALLEYKKIMTKAISS